VREVLANAERRLRAAGSASPRLDAELLAGKTLGLDRVALRIRGHEPAPATQVKALEELVTRREAAEPVAYLLGTAPFRHLDLLVDHRVLIPRPETEALVEWALEQVAARAAGRDEPVRVLDLCTGSGAVALAIALEAAPGSVTLTATDLSPEALEVAQENSSRVGARIELLTGDLFHPVAGRRFDVVVANPPYVRQQDAASLPADVVDHEPHMALFAEGDGLAVADAIILGFPAHAAPGAALALEIGAGQAGAVADRMFETGLAEVGSVADLAGIDRIVTGQLRGPAAAAARLDSPDAEKPTEPC